MFQKSLGAGILIGLAGAVYLIVGGLAGAICFSGGLILICLLDYNLYTGKAGLVITNQCSLKNLFTILIFNLIGAYLVGKVFSITTSNYDAIGKAIQIAEGRCANTWWVNLINGFLCGLLIYCGVTAFKQSKNVIALVACVVFFIMIGAEHSIADIFYYSASMVKNWYLPEIIVIIGNFLGCVFLPIIQQLEKRVI